MLHIFDGKAKATEVLPSSAVCILDGMALLQALESSYFGSHIGFMQLNAKSGSFSLFSYQKRCRKFKQLIYQGKHLYPYIL